MDWTSILFKCKENVHKQIVPFLESISAKGPSLGVGAGGDPIKQVDLAAEKAVIDTLTSHDVSFTLISEESGIRQYGENPKQNYVTVDPIDGTTNLTRGIPFYATSIAVSSKPTLNSVHAALVADLFHKITYTAEKSKGAHRDGEKIFPSDETSLEDAVIGLDLNTYKVKEIAPKITNLIGQTKHIRHLGANALELCYVADGTTDAFIDIRGKLRVTDTAAAWLIIKEAGGKITRPDGNKLNSKLDPKERVNFVASGNAKLHKTILELIKA